MNKLRKAIASIITASAVAVTSLGVLPGISPLTGFVVPAGAEQPTEITTWGGLQTALSAGGDITLTQDIIAESGDSFLSVPLSKTVTLDLNGHIINRNLQAAQNDGYVLKVAGKLTLTDSSEAKTGNITGGNNDGSGGGVYLEADSTFTMSGGMISGNNSKYGGGGVFVLTGGIFTMYDGTISGNNAVWGGGVFIQSGKFTINGGTISGNSADNGGGVYVEQEGTFTMSDGMISGNNVSYGGGGVYLYGTSTINLSEDPKIIGNVKGGTKDVSTGLYTGGTSNNICFTANATINLNGILTDGTNFYSGTLTSGQIEALSGVPVTPAYGVNIVTPTNGTVTASHIAFSADDYTTANKTVTLTVAPNKYYEFSSLTVTSNKDSSTVTTTKVNDTTYTFTMPADSVTVSATFACPPVKYLDENGTEQTCTEYEVLTGGGATTLSGGWYVVKAGWDVSFSDTVTLDGDTHIILENGAKLVLDSSYRENLRCIVSSANLTVYGQSTNNGTDGIINFLISSINGCGIDASGKALIINGGNIIVDINNESSIGIICDTITMNGGKLDIASYGSAIYSEHDITINGGEVIAENGTGIGLFARNDVIKLGWTNTTDSITATDYSNKVTVADGQVLTDGTHFYKGVLTSDEINAIKGKTLRPAYAVNIGTVTNGTVTASPEAFAIDGYETANKTVTLTVTPDTGYDIGEVKYNDGSDHIITPENGVYSFVMPEKNVTVSATFRKSLENSSISVADIADQTYTGSAITPSVTVKDDSTTLNQETDYTVSYSNNINAAAKTTDNAPTVTITGTGSYSGEITAKFTIAKRAVTIKANDQSVELNGSIATGTDKVTASEGDLVSGHKITKITVSTINAIDTVGEYSDAITASGAEINSGSTDVTANYAITYTAGKLTVTNVKAKVTAAPQANTLTYTGAEQELVTAGTANTSMEYSLDGTNYSDDIPKGKKATSYTVYYRAKADNNHEAGDAGTASVTIGQATLTVSGATATGRDYNEEKTVAITAVTLSGIIGTDKVAVNTTNLTGTLEGADVGTYRKVTLPKTLTLTGDDAGNYKLTQPASAVSLTASVDITKGAHADVTSSGSARYGASGSVDLSSLTEVGGSLGTVTVSSGSSLFTETPATSGTKLTYTLVDDENNVGKTATVKVEVENSKNYENYYIEVTITVINCAHTRTTRKNYRASSCTSGGYSGDIYCADCGVLISEGHSTSASGHSYSWTTTKGATCTEAGEEAGICSSCGDTTTRTIKALGHKYDPETGICGNCGEYDPSKFFTVKFDTDGGTEIENQGVKPNGKASKPADPEKKGHTFEGWFVGSTEYDFDTPVTANVTITAHWKANIYTVTFDSAGGSEVDPQKVEYGKKVTKPADPTRGKIVFVEWRLDGKAYDFSTPVTGDITLVAEWDIPKFTVTFDSDGGTAVVPQTVELDALATMPAAPEREGYTFLGWFNGSEAFDFGTKITENITLKAQWQIKTYTVTFDSNGGSAVPAQTVEHGKSVSVHEAPEKAHNTFVEWQLDGTAYSFSTPVKSDITLTALWKAEEYTVTFMFNGELHSTAKVKYGERVKFPALTASEGNIIIGWCTNAELSEKFLESTAVTANITLYAAEVKKEATIVNGEPVTGTVDEAVSKVKGETAVITITENETASKLTFPKETDTKSITIDGSGKTLNFTGSASIAPKQELKMVDLTITAEKNGKPQNVNMTAAPGGLILDSVNVIGKALNINAKKGNLTISDLTLNGEQKPAGDPDNAPVGDGAAASASTMIKLNGAAKTSLTVEGKNTVSTATGFGKLTLDGTLFIEKTLTVNELEITENGVLVVCKGAAVNVKNAVRGNGTIKLMDGFKPLTLNGSASGNISLISDTSLEGKQIFTSKLTILNDVFDVKGIAPVVTDGEYEYGLYAKSNKVYLSAFRFAFDGKTFAEWTDIVNSIAKANAPSASYTVTLLGDADPGTFKLPAKKKYAGLTIDGGNHVITFKGKTLSLTGDLTFKNVTVRSSSGAWTVKTNGFKLDVVGAELENCTIK